MLIKQLRVYNWSSCWQKEHTLHVLSVFLSKQQAGFCGGSGPHNLIPTDEHGKEMLFRYKNRSYVLRGETFANRLVARFITDWNARSSDKSVPLFVPVSFADILEAGELL
jgi:hypothetical protein